MKRGKWTQAGMLALAASALGSDFDCPDGGMGMFTLTEDGIAVVPVGYGAPMTHHASWFWDNYDAVRARVAAALASPARAIVLDLDTPGGEVFGAFETARQIRELATAAGKPVFAFTDALAASAGYALACAADRIFVTPTAHVGSVGVINAIADQTALDAAMGLRFAVIGSGARKTDGCPHVAISEEAIAELTAHTNALAEVFFAWVSERRGKPAEEIRSFEAGVFIGAAAQAAGLADEVVVTKEAMLAAVASLITASAVGKGAATMADDKTEEKDDKKSYADEMRAKLEEDSKSDDESKASAAKKMLAALDADGDDDGDKEKDKGADAEDKKDPPSDDEEDGGHASASAAASVAIEIRREFERRDRKAERARMLAERTDLSKSTLAQLAKMKLEVVKAILEGFPKPKGKSLAAAEQPEVSASVPRGATDPNSPREARLPAAEKAKLDERMGLKPPSGGGIKRTRTSLELGVVPRKKDQMPTAPTAPGKVA